jgi:hypothetical protein
VLGLKSIEDWNRAAVLRHVWNLFAKAGSLWVAWVRANLLKGRCFWKVKMPQNCSQCWRKILKMKDFAKKFLRFMVGDGTTI